MTHAESNGRHSRTLAAGYDPRRLQEACVLIAGTGALGQNTALNLALMGVGEVRLVDVDRFEDHNRTRSPLYRATLEGDAPLKAPAVARELVGHMTGAAGVVRFSSRPIQDLGAGALAGVDVLVCAVDNSAARAWLSDLACAHAVDLVEGGFEGAAVSLSTFPVGPGPAAACWRCSNPSLDGTFSCRFAAAQAESAGIVPALQTGAGALGAMQAEAVAQSLHGALPGPRSVHVHIGTGRSRVVELSADARCPGLHRRLRPLACRVSPADPVAALVAVAEDALDGGAQVTLPQAFVQSAFCTLCGAGVRPDRTEARWRMAPSCEPCGGPVPRDAEVIVASVITSVSAAGPVEILSSSCEQLGLLSGAVAEAVGVDGPSLALRLGGDPATLFETASRTTKPAP